MAKHFQRRGRAPVKEPGFFDTPEYHKLVNQQLQIDNDQHVLDKKDMQEIIDRQDRHIQGLQDELDQSYRDNEDLKCMNKGLEKEVTRLLALLDEKDEKDQQIKYSLIQIVEYCKKCAEWGDARPIVHMLYKLLCQEGTAEDIDLVDSIEDEFKSRKQGINIKDSEVTFKDTQINGSMYEVKNNNQVNLGNKPEETDEDEK